MNQDETRLKVALLIESEVASVYTYEFAQWAQNQDRLLLSHLICHPQKPRLTWITKLLNCFRPNNFICLLRRGLFILITELENRRLNRSSAFKNHTQLYNLINLVPTMIFLAPEVSSGSTYSYSARDILLVKSLNLDLIIASGTHRTPHGAILSAAKFGVISVQYGGNETNRHAPPGFFEVYQKQDATQFAVIRLAEDRDGGDVFIRGCFPTKHFYLLNQASLYKKATYYLMRFLREMAVNRTLPQMIEFQTDVAVSFTIPNLTDQFIYVSTQLASIVTKHASRLFNREQRWGIAFARTDWCTLAFHLSQRITNPPNHFLADPFVITEGDRDFCFVEDYNYKERRAAIAVYELKEKNATRLGQAIVEPFHLSFPYLFQYKNKLYMCPESCERGDIRLYECVHFPLQWKLHKIIMKNVVAVDTMIFEYEGLWWLFTNIDPVRVVDCCSELFIFYSESPLGDNWIPHQKNPVIFDSSKARNGGLLFHMGSIYRVGQNQAFDQYGKSFSINKIDILTKHDYSESASFVVEPNFFSGLRGTHHFHSNNRVSAFDYVAFDRISR
jgi:hypothetical protein